MRIVTLQAENIKRLRAVEITPQDDVVVIAGRNAQGKSSVLDAIWMALAGADGAKQTKRPIRDGEEKASVRLDLGDLVVTRKWTKAGSTLEVAAKDGAKYPSPQTILDGLIGRLSFDPLAFANEDPKKQRQMLVDVLELPFDPDELAMQRQTLYDKRTDVNRDGKRLVAQRDGLPVVPEGTPDEEVSAAAIADELRQAEEQNRKLATLAHERDVQADRVTTLEQELEAAKVRLAEFDAEMTKAPAEIDAAPIRERLAQVDATNAAVRAKKERAHLDAEITRHAERSQRLTQEIEKLDDARDDAIAAASMPLEGLSFDETGVLYQGVPFSQASSAERLRVGTAMAMVLNPKIRVIRITDGSLLDSENLALIEEMAGEHDFQVWIERVDETGTVGITIEDGQIAGALAEVAS